MSNGERLSLRAVGDINTGHGLGWRHSYLPDERTNTATVQQGPKAMLHERVYDYLRSSDLLFGNLEGPISAAYHDADGPSGELLCPPATVELLSDCGFDVVNLANNHIGDYGDRYLEETIRRLEAAGIEYVGSPLDEEVPVTLNRGGYEVTVAGFNLCEEGVTADAEAVFETAARMAERDAVSVLSLHWGWGYEHALEPSPEQIRLGRELIADGIDIVLGHHAHTFQPVEIRNGGAIAYCLGNFVFYQWQATSRQSGILEISVRESASSRGRKLHTDVLPVENADGWVFPAESQRIRENVPKTFDTVPESDAYHRRATARKRAYQRGVLGEYLRNIHRQPVGDTVRRFKRWGSKYIHGP